MFAVLMFHVAHRVGRPFPVRMRSFRIVFGGRRVELPTVFVALGFFPSKTKLLVIRVRDADLLADLFDHVFIRRGIASRRRLVAACLRNGIAWVLVHDRLAAQLPSVVDLLQ